MHARRRPGVGALILLALCAAVARPSAAQVDPAWLGALSWRTIGPFRGGRVLAVTGVPGEPEHFYFGAVNGGVWESRNAGRTWQPIFDDEPVASIGAIAVAPSSPRVLYVGTGEADMRSDIAQGDGMYRSDDGGATWRAIGLADTQQIARILVDPHDPDLVYVAALGHPYGPNDERGVFRSRDGGATWQKLLGPDANTGAADIAFEPGNANVLYAALWQTRRPPWSVYPPSNGPGSGIYKSTDGGAHWTRLNGNGFPERHGRVGFAIAPTEPQRVYAIVDVDPGGGLYRSDDGGAHWRRTSGDTRLWQRGWYFGRIAVDPRNADTVDAMNTLVLRSSDGGSTFVPIRGDNTGDDFHDEWIDPADARRRILAVDQGAIVSMDDGATWSSWNNQPTAQIYHVSTDNRFPYYVYGAQQDSGAVGLPSLTTNRAGITVREFREVTAGGESDMIAPDPRDPDVIYGGRVDRLDLRTRQTRNVDPTLALPDRYRRTWTLPLVFSRTVPGVLYFANQRIFRTEDEGEHWTPISPDLTREQPGTPPNLDPVTTDLRAQSGPRHGVVYAIAPSRLVGQSMWAGTDDGLVWRTEDEGAHWRNVTPSGLEAWSKIGIIESSHHDDATAYLAVDRHRLDDFHPYIYRTHDGGENWELVVDGIDARHAVNVVREDPVRAGLLYAGTERGVYVSFDDGDHWQSLQLDLPVTSVRDLEVKENDLVAATHGRGFWILDDVTPLRELSTEALASKQWLFAPAPAPRLRQENFTGTPLPKEEPTAPNPPLGAHIDYYLAAAPTQALVLTLRDAQGEVVRRYTSDDRPPAVDLAKIDRAPEWVDSPVQLAATPGAHRFVWPMRAAAPEPLADGDPFADGVYAPPGRYTVTLEMDGVRLEQPLELRPDPRIDLPASAYAEQHALAVDIERLRVQVAQAVNAGKVLQKALTARRADAKGRVAAQLDAFQPALTQVTGVVPSEDPNRAWWMAPDSLTSLRALSTKLDSLQRAVDGADAAPSSDARAGFALAQQDVARGLTDWQKLSGEELLKLNTKLGAAGAAPLAAE
jgi:photosystem II stability/assembly factor-like uncharacterized protein